MTSRLVLALPLYTSVSSNWLVSFIAQDKSDVVDFLAVRKIYLSSAMTQLFTRALDSDVEWDRIVVLEADMILPTGALKRIADYPDEIDIVGSLYFQHTHPHHPMVFEQVDDDHYRTLAPNQMEEMIDKPGLYPVDGIGFGLTSVHRRVLEKWDKNVPLFAAQQETLGHDLFFCRGAIRQGFGVYVDTAITCGHLTEEVTGLADYRQAITAMTQGD